MMRYRNGGPCGPGPVCYTPSPAIYGSGRLYQPWALAAQLPGQAYMFGATDAGVPIAQVSAACPTGSPAAWFPGRNPDPIGGDVVGAGIFQPKVPLYWDRPTLGPDHGRWAVPGYIAREPDQGWWVSEAKDEFSGARSWITNMVSGLGGLGGLGAVGDSVYEVRPAPHALYAGDTRVPYTPPAAAFWDGYTTRSTGAAHIGAAGRRPVSRALPWGSRVMLWRGAPARAGWIPVRLETGTSGYLPATAVHLIPVSTPALPDQGARAFHGLGFLETTGSKVAAFAVAGAAAFGLWYFLKKGKKRSRRRNAGKVSWKTGDRVRQGKDEGRLLLVEGDYGIVGWDARGKGGPIGTSREALKTLRRGAPRKPWSGVPWE